MTQGSAYLLIILVAAMLYADATMYDWAYSLWAAQHFDGLVQYLKFWR